MATRLTCLQVDGKSSVACYLMALDKCYASLCEKFERCRSNFERQRRLVRSSSGSAKGCTGGASVIWDRRVSRFLAGGW